jgi:tight adherence protein C
MSSGLLFILGAFCCLLSACAVGLLVSAGFEGQFWIRRQSRKSLARLAHGSGHSDLCRDGSSEPSAQPAWSYLTALLHKTHFYHLFIEPRVQRRSEEALREQCLYDLPEMIDILSLALGAGLSFDQAFELYVEAFDTPLATEFGAALQAYRVGMLSRARAFEEVAAHIPEEAVVRFVAVVRQAMTLGSALAGTFDTLAFETRRYRKAKLEERIAKTPVKMLIPLGTCILPAVLILLMGPVMMQVINGMNF